VIKEQIGHLTTKYVDQNRGLTGKSFDQNRVLTGKTITGGIGNPGKQSRLSAIGNIFL
jgi:hypothetical protein